MIDVTAVTDGEVLKVLLNADQDKAVAFISSPGVEEKPAVKQMTVGKKDAKAIDHVKRMVKSASEEARLAQIKMLFPEVKRVFGANLDRWIASASVQYKISETFYDSSQWDEARKRLKSHVLSRNPGGALGTSAKFLYGKGLARTDRYQEAVDIFESLQDGKE